MCFPELSISSFVTIVHRAFQMKITAYFCLVFCKVLSHLEHMTCSTRYFHREHPVPSPTLIRTTSNLVWLQMFLFLLSFEPIKTSPSSLLDIFFAWNFLSQNICMIIILPLYLGICSSLISTELSFPQEQLLPPLSLSPYPALFLLTISIIQAIAHIYFLALIHTHTHTVVDHVFMNISKMENT